MLQDRGTAALRICKGKGKALMNSSAQGMLPGKAVGAESWRMTGVSQVRRGGACVPGSKWEEQVPRSGSGKDPDVFPLDVFALGFC